MEVEQEILLENAISAHLAEKRTYPGAGVPCETPGMNHDAAWKRLFGLPVLIEHLLGGFVRPIAKRHKFSKPRQLPADSVDADARQRHGDAAWRVDFKDDSRRRSLVLLIEFQSGVDPSMAARMRGYAGCGPGAAAPAGGIGRGRRGPGVAGGVVLGASVRGNAPGGAR